MDRDSAWSKSENVLYESNFLKKGVPGIISGNSVFRIQIQGENVVKPWTKSHSDSQTWVINWNESKSYCINGPYHSWSETSWGMVWLLVGPNFKKVYPPAKVFFWASSCFSIGRETCPQSNKAHSVECISYSFIPKNS